MNNKERCGFLIVASVFVYTLALVLYSELWVLAAAANEGQWDNFIPSLIVATIVLAFIFYWGRALWRGQGEARLHFVLLPVGLGMLLVFVGYLFSTLLKPVNPNWTPEELAKVQAFRDRLSLWIIGAGVLNILAGASLLLPPVGHFLRHRRLMRGEPQSDSPAS
jgi:hypothetical protein